MQSRRREHGSSGELDVFGATSYFAGLPPAPDDDYRCRPSSATEPSSADRLYFQAAKEDNSFRGPHQQQLAAGLHGHSERHASSKQQLVAAKRRQPSYSGKSKLAALLSFMLVSSPSPSRRANSFRKEINKQEAPSSTRLRHQAEAAAAASAASGEKETCKAANSRSSSSRESIVMQLQGLLGAHDDDDDEELVDLGAATGDRRLQGITVVRGIGGGEERWVVRCVPCGAWDEEEEEERRDNMLDAEESASSEQNIKDETMMVEAEKPGHGDDDGNIDPAHSSWDSDSSSDLFDLDLEY